MEKNFYLSFESADKENKKIAKFTSKLQKEYEKLLKKLEKDFVKATKHFVDENKGDYINDVFADILLETGFDFGNHNTRRFFTEDYCRPREIASIHGDGEVQVIGECLPDGEEFSDWASLKKYLEEVKAKAYIIDSYEKKYTVDTFIELIEKHQ